LKPEAANLAIEPTKEVAMPKSDAGPGSGRGLSVRAAVSGALRPRGLAAGAGSMEADSGVERRTPLADTSTVETKGDFAWGGMG
jgi:hypothetical protein